MSQYVCCDSVPNGNVHRLVSQPLIICVHLLFQEVLKYTLLLLTEPEHLRSKGVLGQILVKSCSPLSWASRIVLLVSVHKRLLWDVLHFPPILNICREHQVYHLPNIYGRYNKSFKGKKCSFTAFKRGFHGKRAKLLSPCKTLEWGKRVGNT